MSQDALSDSVSSTETTATGCYQDPIPSTATSEENRALYEENLANAREILAIVENMEVRQHQWREELMEHFIVEALQQQQSAELTGRVAIAEEELLNQPRYVAKLAAVDAEKEKSGNDLSTWYTCDDLLKATPFACCIPYPRGLSLSARETVAERVNAFCLQSPFYVETADFSLPLQQCARNLGCSHEITSCDDKAGYFTASCTSGADVLAIIDESADLQKALDKTTAILIHDLADGFPSAARRRLMHSQQSSETSTKVALSRVFVIGGNVVAIETTQPLSALSQNFSTSLASFVTKHILPAFPNRSFVCHATTHEGDGDALQHFLLSIDHLDRATYDCFTLEEVVAVARHAEGGKRPPVVRSAAEASHAPLSPAAPTAPAAPPTAAPPTPPPADVPRRAPRGHSTAALAATAVATAAATAALSWAVGRRR